MKVVFRITGVFAVVLTALAATASAAERPVVLIPGPREMSLSDGTFTIRPDTMIVHDDNADLRRIARQLASNLEPATGYEFELTANPPRSDNVIRLAIQEKGLPLGNEGYELTVSPNRVVI